jgi:chaperone required for assembly of F1-ATPase
LVERSNNSTCEDRISNIPLFPKIKLNSVRFSPWNSTGATTSTAMTGSKMTGLALLKASLKAPKAASLKANSDES